MTTLTFVLCIASAGVAAYLTNWYDRRHEPALIRRLHAAIETERRRAWRAEHRLAVWTGFRETTVIAVDRRGPE